MYFPESNNLLLHGFAKGRQTALEITQYALEIIDPYKTTLKTLKLSEPILTIDTFSIDLSTKESIYVLGGGKAVYPVAKALEELLGDRITEGLIIVKEGHQGSLKRIKIREGSHPIPDQKGLAAAKEIMQIARKAGEKDLVFWINTGGISAVAPLPVNEISLKEKRLITDLLLRCGANIEEINTVRSHLSKIKGGRLAAVIFPAELINLLVSDNPGDPLTVGPTGLDKTTFAEAIAVLKRYNIWDRCPDTVCDYLVRATPEMETPKDYGVYKSRVYTYILVNNRMACLGAVEKAKTLQMNHLFLSSLIEGEAKEVAKVQAAIAREVWLSGNPVPAPACIISGGETVVNVKGDGLGGSNLEFALATAIEIKGLENMVLVSIGTDGTDGPTDAAGAIVDGYTYQRAIDLGLDPQEYLQRNDSYNFFKELDDLIITGHTDTNVMDLRVLLVL